MHKDILNPKLAVASSLCIVTIFTMTIISEWANYTPAAIIAVIALIFFTIIEWHRLDLTAKLLASITASFTLILFLRSQITLQELGIICNSVAFFSFLLIALGVLKDAALTSNSIRLTGLALLEQKPTWRYAMLTVTAHILGILMSLGSVNLLGTMVQQGLSHNSNAIDPRIEQARKRRMMMAVMRGFCSIPLWAPTSVTIALLVTTIPKLQWTDILPYGLYMAVAMLLFGAWLDHIKAPKHLRHLVPTISGDLSDLKVSIPIGIVVITLAILSTILIVSTPLSPISSVLISAPIVSAAWIFMQFNHNHNKTISAQLTIKRFHKQVFQQLPVQRSEILLFSCSIAIGRLLLSVLDLDWIAVQLAYLNMPPSSILILASWTIILCSFIFINPMISVTVMAGVLSQLPVVGSMPVTIALVMMLTWAVVIGMSPFTASVRVGAKVIGVSPEQLGLEWNGWFSVIVLVVLDIFLVALI
ncbi:MAG: hypothetical protein HRT51_00405 [Colwellia sp.]|nr:hypothetical protein [Colwellia sp.]